MKKTIPSFIIALFCLVLSQTSFSQISVVSTNGYTVNIVVQPKSIVTNNNSCTWGYNYNVRMDYNVTFTGNNIPSSLYTLQGTLGCGSSSHFFDLPNGASAGTVTSQSNVWRSTPDCGTASVSTLTCTIINIQVHGPGISNRTVSFTVSASPLPVTLVDFTAEALKGRVKLNWSTATEINNDFFTVERSADGVSWQVIKTIKGMENSTSLTGYTCFDESPLAGTAYYRLKQTDLDGKYTYSDTRMVKYSVAGTITVFPVPNAGNTITFSGIADPAMTGVTIRNAAGLRVFNTMLSGNTIQLPTLPAGLYIITVTNKMNGEVSNLRYVKI